LDAKKATLTASYEPKKATGTKRHKLYLR
jgi:hypothetical protein